ASLGISRSAVETLLFRARRGFRAAYEGVVTTDQPVGCPELAPMLSKMVDGELQLAASRELSTHLRGCRRCRRELDELRRTRRLHALIPLLAAPAGWSWAAAAEAAGLAAAATVGPALP